jgi:hypothetical protein
MLLTDLLFLEIRDRSGELFFADLFPRKFPECFYQTHQPTHFTSWLRRPNFRSNSTTAFDGSGGGKPRRQSPPASLLTLWLQVVLSAKVWRAAARYVPPPSLYSSAPRSPESPEEDGHTDYRAYHRHACIKSIDHASTGLMPRILRAFI